MRGSCRSGRRRNASVRPGLSRERVPVAAVVEQQGHPRWRQTAAVACRLCLSFFFSSITFSSRRLSIATSYWRLPAQVCRASREPGRSPTWPPAASRRFLSRGHRERFGSTQALKHGRSLWPMPHGRRLRRRSATQDATSATPWVPSRMQPPTTMRAPCQAGGGLEAGDGDH